MAGVARPYPTQRAGDRTGAAAEVGDLPRRALVAIDLLGLALTWGLTFTVAAQGDHHPLVLVAAVLAVTVIALALMRQGRLYRSDADRARSEEVAWLTVIGALTGLAAYGVAQVANLEISAAGYVVGAGAAFIALVVLRSHFHGWLSRRRANGQYARPVVVVGDGPSAADLVELFRDAPELGLVPVGVVGPTGDEAAGLGLAVLPPGDVVAAAEACGARGAVLCASGFGPAQLDRCVRELLAADIDVHVSSGIQGLHHRRLRVHPLAHEPLIHVEPHRLSRAQLGAKRGLDLVGSFAGIVLTLPVLALAALAIKLEDGGPVLFRQARVGRGGTRFTVVKLRTMVPDAEARLAEVADRNERTGPLFKVADDPRTTRVGRLLRTSGIDELPQLWNVLRGEMSLVGPRPALPSEVEQFDGRLLDRLAVRPGMTGLWQVEGGDKASFTAYRRLDLFYVDNWSVWLDLDILLRTAGAVGRRVRTAGAVRRHPSSRVAPGADVVGLPDPGDIAPGVVLDLRGATAEIDVCAPAVAAEPLPLVQGVEG